MRSSREQSACCQRWHKSAVDSPKVGNSKSNSTSESHAAAFENPFRFRSQQKCPEFKPPLRGR